MTVPDLTWRPCDHERAVDGECVDCGARVIEVIKRWTPNGPEVLRELWSLPTEREDHT